MQRHTYGHDTRMTSQVHMNNYVPQPETDTILIPQLEQLEIIKRTIMYMYNRYMSLRVSHINIAKQVPLNSPHLEVD